MASIDDYQQDDSAQGRFGAWRNAWGVAKNYPLGAGFNPNLQEFFDRYSDGTQARAAHSIYFQVLGNHGFVGLFLFMGLFGSTYLLAGRLRKRAMKVTEGRWCEQLGAMCQVSLVGYFVGGAFLSLSYFDLPYNLMAMVVLAHAWLKREAWKTEPLLPKRWWSIPGVPTAAAVVPGNAPTAQFK